MAPLSRLEHNVFASQDAHEQLATLGAGFLCRGVWKTLAHTIDV